MTLTRQSTVGERLTRISEHGPTRRARSLVHLEVNGLSQLNASFGRKAGDALLRQVELSLRLRTRRYRDTVWRVEGDELAVLFVGATRLQALRAIRRVFAEPMLPAEWSSLSLGLSVGIVSLDAEKPLEDAVALAENAMCAAKRTRRAAATIGRDATSLRVALATLKSTEASSPATHGPTHPAAHGGVQCQAS